MSIKLTRIVKILMITCFAVFVMQQTVDRYFDGHFLETFGLIPYRFGVQHWFWQLFTYSFLHGEVSHLFLNLLMLAFIGSEIEGVWGAARFLRFYFFCCTAAGVAYLLMQFGVSGQMGMPMVGASGGLFGLLVAYGLMFGERVMLFMLVFPMKAKHFVWVLAGIELMTLLFSPGGGLSSVAHLAGMLAGFGYLWANTQWRIRKRTAGAAKKTKRIQAARNQNHLKLVVNKPRVGSDDPDEEKGPKTWH